jgi:uncharacterized protein YcgI (DUF1989 family)
MKFHQGLAVLLALLMPFVTVGGNEEDGNRVRKVEQTQHFATDRERYNQNGHRRLSSVSHLTAEKACEHWGAGKDDCVFDVLSTGDLDMALDGEY